MVFSEFIESLEQGGGFLSKELRQLRAWFILTHHEIKSGLIRLCLVLMIGLCLLLKTHAEAFLDFVVLEQLSSDYGEPALKRGERLNQLLLDLKDKDIETQLVEVNRFFNQATHRFDQDLWGESDYWATPEEFIGLNAGDCEDFVIAKYFTLRYLGVADDRLYLTYVKALKQNVAHMVLSYFENASEYSARS